MDQRDICSLSDLEAICRRELSQVEGMEGLERVVVGLRDGALLEGSPNWMINHITPRPSNVVLRRAAPVISRLQAACRLAA